MRRNKSAFCRQIPRRRRTSKRKFVRETRGREPEELRVDPGELRPVPTPHWQRARSPSATPIGRSDGVPDCRPRRARCRPAALPTHRIPVARTALRRAGRAARTPSGDRYDWTFIAPQETPCSFVRLRRSIPHVDNLCVLRHQCRPAELAFDLLAQGIGSDGFAMGDERRTRRRLEIAQPLQCLCRVGMG